MKDSGLLRKLFNIPSTPLFPLPNDNSGFNKFPRSYPSRWLLPDLSLHFTVFSKMKKLRIRATVITIETGMILIHNNIVGVFL